MTPNQLPPLPAIDPVLGHPEHHMKWTRPELAWIQQYATDYALAALAQQAQVKPFAYMDDDVAAGVLEGSVLLSAAIRGAPGGTFNFPLYTRAQQAQEPVAAALGEIVALWDKYAPSEYMTAIHMQAKRALAGQQPVSPDMHRWCAYVGSMVACWITSEPDAHARLGDDKFEVAIAGIIERRLWAMPKRDTTPPSPQPAPVDEREAFKVELSNMPEWAPEFECHRAWVEHLLWTFWQARAELQSPAPQAGGWLPIESAPKDGTRLILWWGGKPVFAGWLDNSQCKHPWAGWQTPSLTPRPQGEPTHYMLLPPAPQTKGGEA